MATGNRSSVGLKDRVLLGVLKRSLLAQAFGARQLRRLGDFLAGFTMAALAPALRTALTSAVYGSRGDYELEGIFEWEREWFEHDLPPPPASLLVGGAGSGRETRYLRQKGYDIVAFDPAEAFVRSSSNLPGAAASDTFLVGSYEALANPTSDKARSFANRVEALGPYDAVVLGWGSFTHIATDSYRVALLRRLRGLCPDGPVLLSFWMRGEDSQLRRGRMWKAGWQVGSRLVRSGAALADLSDGDCVIGNAGFGHLFTLLEIRKLAAATGYTISREPGGAFVGTFPHATFRP